VRRARKVPAIPYRLEVQSDLAKSGARCCPTCGRDWDGVAVKICWLCGETVKRGERHRVVACGPGVFRFEHVRCDRAPR
jgi:hypothetical protein